MTVSDEGTLRWWVGRPGRLPRCGVASLQLPSRGLCNTTAVCNSIWGSARQLGWWSGIWGRAPTVTPQWSGHTSLAFL